MRRCGVFVLGSLLLGAAFALGGCGGTSLRRVVPGAIETTPQGDTRGGPRQAAMDGPALGVLPLRDRDWEAVAQLSPEAHDATVADRPDASDDAGRATGESPRGEVQPAASGLSAGGLSTVTGEQTVDGLSAGQAFGAGPRGSTASGVHAGTTFAEGAIRSVRTGPASFSAATSGGGTALDVVTRSGREGFHGGISGMLRESAWAATNPFSELTRYAASGTGYSAANVVTVFAKPDDSVGQVSGSVGGPIAAGKLRDRLQGFAAAEVQLRSDPIESGPGTPDFFALSATQLALLGTRGVSSMQTDAALGYLDSLMGLVGRSSSRVLSFVRADAEPSKLDHVEAAWVRSRFLSPAGSGFASPSEAVVPRGRGSLGDEVLRLDGATAAWDHGFGRRWVNDLRGQWSRDLEYEQPRAPLPQEPAIAPGGFAPEVDISPEGFSYGTPASLGKSAFPEETRTELAERAAWSGGRHLVQIGADWSRIGDNVASQPDVDGTFSYDSGTTGGRAGGLVDWISDWALGVNAYPNGACPSITAAVHRFCFHSYQQTFGTQQVTWWTHEIAAFAEDTWRLTDRLSVSAGVRWEYTLLPLPQHPNEALDAALNAALAPGDGRVGTTASFPEDRNNFGPRLSVAWTAPFGFRVRAGYGVFFGRVPGATVETALADTALPSSITRIRITPTTETICPQQPTVSFGYPCAYVAAPPAAVAQTTSATVFARNFRVPVVQRMSFTVEHALGRGATLSLGYSGARATQLPGTVDLNVAASVATAQFLLLGGDGRPGARDGETFALPVYTSRLIPQYGPVFAVNSAANASYDALVAEANAAWRMLALHAGYAWSHADDYGPQMSAFPYGMTQLDPFRNGYDKGRSSLDFTHHFAGSLIWSPSAGSGPAWERRLLGGWRVSAIGTAGSGAPYSYRIYGGSYLSGGSDSINGAGGATYLPTSGRDTLRLPPRGKLDLRVSRDVTVRRDVRVTAFAEAFNLLNSRNLSRVETRAFLPGTAAAGVTPLVFQDAATVAAEGVSTPPFGAATSSTGGLSRERQMEIGVRASF